MAREIEEPVTTKKPGPGGTDETVTTHPAFAQIGAHRVQGRTNLYGSDFSHNGFMVIRIHPSQLRRNLYRDWHFTDRMPYIEVALSEAQWATFVSAPNIGDGVPCTLQAFNGERIPGLPDPESRVDQFKAEMQASLENVIERVDELIEAAKTQTQKKELGLLRQQIVSNLPFVAKQFGKHVETTVEKAKQEVHGYMTQVIQRAGIEALTNGQLPLQIEHRGDDA